MSHENCIEFQKKKKNSTSEERDRRIDSRSLKNYVQEAHVYMNKFKLIPKEETDNHMQT